MKKIIVVLLVTLTLISCSEYQKALKTEDVAVKNEVAEKLYNAGKYKKAIRLYEQIAPSFRGKPNAERLFYFYSKALYQNKQYYLAGYQLENFVSAYPRSEKKEEASFLAAECYYNLSPVYSLDQSDTDKALAKLQNFIDTYPNSEYLTKANEYYRNLQLKLEKKDFEIAKQYYDISDYRYEYTTAIKALDNFIADYPGTPYKEEAMFYKFSAAYKLAKQSIPSKKTERYLQAKSNYNSLIKFKPDSKFKDEADQILATIEKELEQLPNNN